MTNKEEEILNTIYISETNNMHSEILKCIETYCNKINALTKDTEIHLEGKIVEYPLELFIASAHGYLFEKLYDGDKEKGNFILDNYIKMVNK